MVLLTESRAFWLLTCWELEKKNGLYAFQPALSAAQAPQMCRGAYAFIAGVTGAPPSTARERTALCGEIRAAAPGCKLLWLIEQPENHALIGPVTQAKRDGVIDQFLYTGVSPNYLAAVLDTL